MEHATLDMFSKEVYEPIVTIRGKLCDKVTLIIKIENTWCVMHPALSTSAYVGLSNFTSSLLGFVLLPFSTQELWLDICIINLNKIV